MANDLGAACSAIRLQRRHVVDANAAEALDDLVQRLDALGRMQRLLLCPAAGGTTELALRVRELCEAFQEARFAPTDDLLMLDIAHEDIPLAAPRAWRILLIITELLTNAARHGRRSSTSRVRVSLSSCPRDIVCVVENEGLPAPGAVQGYGSRVIEALVSELDGRLETSAEASGTSVRLVAPRLPPGCIRQMSLHYATDSP
jgi:two-component sensor histidine kinase